MARDEPKPLLIRLILFILGGYCGVAIAVMALFAPFLMVANWGGGRSGSPGVFELLVGISLLVVGFGLPMLIFAREARRWKPMVLVFGVMALVLIWAMVRGGSDALSFAALMGVAALHGTGFFFAFRALSGPPVPSAWKDMP